MRGSRVTGLAAVLALLLSLAGCPSGDNGVVVPTQYYTINGTASGLTGTGLVLQNNNADDLDITSDGAFIFNTAIADGSIYNATVLTQPTGQGCTIANGIGTVRGADVTDLAVTCDSKGLGVYVGDGDTEEYYIYGIDSGLLIDNWYSVDQFFGAVLLAHAPGGGDLHAPGDHKFYIVASPRQIEVDAIKLGFDPGVYLDATNTWSWGDLSGSSPANVYDEPDGQVVFVGQTYGSSGGTYSGYIIVENPDW